MILNISRKMLILNPATLVPLDLSDLFLKMLGDIHHLLRTMKLGLYLDFNNTYHSSNGSEIMNLASMKSKKIRNKVSILNKQIWLYFMRILGRNSTLLRLLWPKHLLIKNIPLSNKKRHEERVVNNKQNLLERWSEKVKSTIKFFELTIKKFKVCFSI